MSSLVLIPELGRRQRGKFLKGTVKSRLGIEAAFKPYGDYGVWVVIRVRKENLGLFHPELIDEVIKAFVPVEVDNPGKVSTADLFLLGELFQCQVRIEVVAIFNDAGPDLLKLLEVLLLKAVPGFNNLAVQAAGFLLYGFTDQDPVLHDIIAVQALVPYPVQQQG